MKVGFIGLGKMGAGICSNIVKNGIDVVVYDINPANVQKFVDMGASSAATVKELAAQVDVCITCVPMPKDAKDVLLGPDGVFENLPEGGVHFDLSTLDIETVVMLEAEAAKLGKKYLVIPMGKGPAFAADGTCPLFTCKVDQQAGEGQYLDAVQIAEGLAGQRHALVENKGGTHAVFTLRFGHGDNHAGKDAAGSANHVYVAKGDGIEGARDDYAVDSVIHGCPPMAHPRHFRSRQHGRSRPRPPSAASQPR